MNPKQTLNGLAQSDPETYRRIIVAIMDLAAGEATIEEFLRAIENKERQNELRN